jgi:thioredoxin-related protein
MKKISIILCLLCSVAYSVTGQEKEASFQVMTWEEAIEVAARARKMILVDVTRASMNLQNQEEKERVEKEVMHADSSRSFWANNVIAIRMDMGTEQGRAFAPRLQMNMYPTYGFFMPNGDLLKVINPYKVAQDPGLLQKTAEEAWNMAVEKRMNTRSIRFEEGDFEAALEKAKSEKKVLFVDALTDPCQPCIMMDRNVFTLDKVADFYNHHFINVRVNFGTIRKDLAEKYGTYAYPTYLYVDANGEVIHTAGGYSEADKFIGYGEEALRKCKERK